MHILPSFSRTMHWGIFGTNSQTKYFHLAPFCYCILPCHRNVNFYSYLLSWKVTNYFLKLQEYYTFVFSALNISSVVNILSHLFLLLSLIHLSLFLSLDRCMDGSIHIHIQVHFSWIIAELSANITIRT